MSRVPAILTKRIDERGAELGMTPRQISMLAVGNGDAIRNIGRGAMPSADRLERIADVLQTTSNWLLGEEGGQMPINPDRITTYAAQHLDAVMIPFYNAPHSMGAGSTFDIEASHEMVPLAKSWLRGKVSGGLDQLMLLPGQGDSMEPTIRDGDVVLVDKAQTVVSQPDRIWAFNHLESGYIKRLRRARLGEFTVSSDNKAVSEWPADIADITIVGRVVSIMRWQ